MVANHSVSLFFPRLQFWHDKERLGLGRNFGVFSLLCPAHPVPQNSHLPTILTPTFPPRLQSSAPLVTTTTPPSIAVSAVLWAPISLTSVRTSAPAVQETQALTLTAPPVWPSARVCGRPSCGKRGREVWEQWAWEEVGGGASKPTGSKAREWMGRKAPPSISPIPLNLKTTCWAGLHGTLSLEIGDGETERGEVR